MLHSRAATIADRVRETGGRTSGFDYLRICLAASIILWHGIPVSYGAQVELQYWHGPFGIGMHFVLPMFFALSGFLVAGSLERCPTLVSFFGLRILRIVPALAVEITLSALIFGPLLTTVALSQYFGSQEFATYFLNLVGYIHYRLPGLFLNNPLPRLVNAQLWTIPFELQCYVAIGALAVAGFVRRRGLLLAVAAVSQGLWAWEAIRRGADSSSGGASGAVLIVCFLVGILFHLYRDRIRLHPLLFAIAVVAGIALSALPHGSYYLPLPATYIVVYLGLLNPRKLWIVSSGDYSYGMYLYGYPLQQAVASIGPVTHHWAINVGIALPAAWLVAYCSWHYVERRALSLRSHLPALEARIVRWVSDRRQVLVAGASGVVQQREIIDSVLLAGVCAAGVAGVLLLVLVHEVLGILSIVLACFAVRVSLYRLRGV